MGWPVQDQYATISAYDVMSFQARVIFGAGTTSTWRSRDMTVTRPSATTLVLALPQIFGEVVFFKANRFAVSGVATQEWVITTNNVTVDGTITLTCMIAAGTPTTPATNDQVFIDIGVSSSAPNDRYVGTTP